MEEIVSVDKFLIDITPNPGDENFRFDVYRARSDGPFNADVTMLHRGRITTGYSDTFEGAKLRAQAVVNHMNDVRNYTSYTYPVSMDDMLCKLAETTTRFWDSGVAEATVRSEDLRLNGRELTELEYHKYCRFVDSLQEKHVQRLDRKRRVENGELYVPPKEIDQR